MAIPVVNFNPETFQQANPMLAGMGAAQDLYAKGIQNRYLAPMLAQQLQQAQLQNQIMQPQAQYAPQLTAADLAYKQAQAPFASAQTQGILRGQIPLQQSQAALAGTESQLNQFKLAHPEVMLGGIAGNLGSYALLQKMYPGLFSTPSAVSPTSSQGVANNLSRGVATSLPAVPSAGQFTASPSASNAPILPQNPYAGAAGVSPTGGGGGSMTPGQLPGVSDMANMLLQQQFAPLRKDMAQADFYTTKSNLANFSALPQDTRNQLIAQGRGVGMSPTETLGFIAQGGDMNKLMQSVEQRTGQSSTPIYAPSQTSLQKAQISSAATAALTDINPLITNALAPYSRQFLGFSPKLVIQELAGKDPDSVGQALAARALAPEIASLRLKAMNATSGIEAIREVKESSMLTLKNFQGMVSPKTYALANQYLDNWVARMSNTYNKSLVNMPNQVNVPASPSGVGSPSAYGTPLSKVVNGVPYIFTQGKWHS